MSEQTSKSTKQKVEGPSQSPDPCVRNSSKIAGTSEPPSSGGPRRHLSPNQRAWRRFRSNRLAALGALFLIVVIGLALLWPLFSAPALAPYLPRPMTFLPEPFVDVPFQAPSGLHWFGTDVHGRDLLSRVLYGARISLVVAAMGTIVSLVIGVLWGALAGYIGGQLDSFMMRCVDVLYSLPSIIFVIVLMTTLEGLFRDWLAHKFSPEAGAVARMLFLFAGLGGISWLTMARIVRGQVLTLRTRGFIEASRALGATHIRILLRHILPNVSGIVIVYLMLLVPSIILYESFLSYLGLGVQPPHASLGSLIAEGTAQINPIRIYWWVVVFPGVTLISMLLALNFVGDGLRDAFDPRSLRDA